MKAAQEVCEHYIALIADFQQRLGVWEENEDSCATTYVYAKFYDENGEIDKFWTPRNP